MYNRALSLFVFVLVSIPLFHLRAATFTVTTTADSGAGSLRQAIIDANANAGPDVIDFNIGPAGEKTITLANASGALPAITDPVTIDGTTQLGFASKPAIELNGGSVLTAVDGLRITTSNCVVRGLVINRFRSDGIEINGGGNNVIEGCIIGLNLAGTTASANSFNGVLISSSSSNRIGGATVAARNIVSGNAEQGVRIDGVSSVGNVVSGNYIGLDISGALDRGNGQHGVYVNGAIATTIGGATVDDRNVISGNEQNGILLEGAGAERAGVYGNYIGTDAQGLADLGNTADGVRVNSVGNHHIGQAGKGNLISGNNSDGIEITGASATNNYVLGNLIGVNSTGAAALANSAHGVQVSGGASWNYVGWLVPGQGNTIAFNNQDAVYVLNGTNNSVRANSMFSNGGLGIDLDPNGGTANDANDVDTGANQQQNCPVLISATTSASETTVSGTLNSTPNGMFWIDVYSVANPDATGGEGQQYLGAFMANTDATANGSFNVTLPVAASGKYLCATATDEWGNTSEYSANINVATTAPGSTFTVTTAADSGAGSLRQAILDANTAPGLNTIAFNIAGDGPHTITNLTALAAVMNSVIIDGFTQPGAVANTHAAAFNGTLKIILTRASATSFDGLSLQWPGCTVRGLNIIGMGGDGIEVGLGAHGCLVEGCVIGMDLASVKRANSGNGVSINSSGNRIGGTTLAARNVISGNISSGVWLVGTGNTVVGNNIGLTLNGTAKVGNGQDGVRIGGSNNTIGGTSPGARNVIAGSVHDGIEISGSIATNNVVQGNYIGTDVTGVKALGNEDYGINLSFSSRNSVIGGVAPGAANLIAFNLQDGIGISAGTNNVIRGNSIHSNSGLGIDIDLNGVTTNDFGDGDVGANQRQNFPLITSALSHAATTDVSGALNSGTNLTYTLDFYANAVADPVFAGAYNSIGNGEGQQYLGSTEVMTDGSGNATFSVTLPTAATGKFICATATDSFGNTSEFGLCLGALSDVPGQTFIVTTTADSGAGSLRQAIIDANALFTKGDTITFNIPGVGPHIISLATASPLPELTDSVTIDGYTQPGAAKNTDANAFNGVLKIVLDGTNVNLMAAGLSAQWSDVTIRGLNVIGFRDGIELGTFATRSAVEGCLIGIGLDGARRLNRNDGIFVDGATNVVIGGHTPGTRNVISGNGRNGVYILAGVTNSVFGNLIGLAMDGINPVSNRGAGVNITGGSRDNTIGGATVTVRNVISGNLGNGIAIDGSTTSRNSVLGNYIGSDVIGSAPAGNAGAGVWVLGGHNNRIGGLSAGEGNLIAFNNGDGVTIYAGNNSGTNNAIRANLIFGHNDLGIDLSNNGVTANDIGDGDTGANSFQNFPVLTAATANPANTRIVGTLNSRPDTTYQVDFFSNLQFVATGVYEAEKYLGSAAVTTDATGNASFDVSVNAVVNGRFITATATDPNGNTSEFSAYVRSESTIPAPILMVTTSADSGEGSLRQALLDAGSYVVGEPVKIDFNIPGDGPHFIYPTTTLPTPTEPVFLNGFSQPGASPNTLAQGNDAILQINLSGSNVNSSAGLRLTNSGNIIRGLAIIQFGQHGIELNGDSNRVEGCFIGLDSAVVARGNFPSGVRIISLNPFSGNPTGGANNIIGGTAPAARNVISGNSTQIMIEYAGSSNVIQGNYIGTNPSGATGYDNSVGAAIQISVAPNTIVGGAGASEGNLISGNNGRGIYISDAASVGTRILGNKIGTDVTGALGLPNNTGIEITSSASDAVIGGIQPGEGNLIAFNNGHGVLISSGTNNAVRANTMHSNTLLAINLGFDQVTQNDVDDIDTGPNDYQNFPVITSAHGTATDTTIAGTLNSLPNRTYALDFYANILSDPSGHGEAEQYLGSGSVTTGADGNGSFSVTLTAVINGRFISATATDPDGNTSELSRGFEATTTFPAETFVVTNTNDSGPGSLRQAILDNNRSRAGANNLINFNIPGDGPHTITPATSLDTPTHAVTIDGFTQSGASANTLAVANNSVLKIRIDGNNTFQTGLTLGARNSIVRGLSITRGGTGLIVEASGVQVAGCWLGLAPDGTAARNQSFGINISSGSDVVIGGTTPADRNVISENNTYGILFGVDTAGARVEGNYIGTSPAGTVAMGNGTSGILLAGSNHTIGGVDSGARNIISGNPQGMSLNRATNSTIQGNYIGVDATGTARFNSSTGAGIDFSNASPGNVIRGNVVSGNSYFGIALLGAESTGNRIVGNLIGTDATGSVGLPNSNAGVGIGVSDNQVGGVDEADRNIIAFNSQQGVSVFSTATSASIRKNQIFRNSQIGIDLAANGATANDASDADTGPNELQNFPVITATTIGVSDVQISGYLQSAASQAFDVDFFANVSSDPSGHGEGEQFLGSAVVNTGVDGRGDFSVTFAKVVNGRFITSTATASQGNSSEFSAAFRATSTRPRQTLVVTTDSDSGAGSLRQALTDAGNIMSAGANKIHFNIPGGGLRIIQVLSQLPTPAEPVEIDASTQPGSASNTQADRDAAVRLVELRGAALSNFEDGLRFNSVGNIVRGLIVSQFPGNGVVLSNADNSIVEGSLVLSNGSSGVVINNSIGDVIGGAEPQKRNTISGNASGGIFVSTPILPGRVADNRILGNFIGLDMNGGNTYRVQNHGIYISTGLQTQVGGTSAGEGNWIAYNTRGVTIQNSSENRIRGNRIFSNNLLGVDLGFNNLTQNDAGDADNGANALQNFPVVQTANITTSGTRFVGTLNSIANSNFTIDFYSSDSCDNNGFGEGARYLGQTSVSTDASGNAAFDFVLPSRIPRGVVTATATDAAGNTSEFSACTTVGTEIPPQTFLVTNTNDSGPGSLRQAIFDANDAFTTGRNSIAFNIPGSGVRMISPSTQLPDISSLVAIDGFTQPGAQVNTSSTGINAVLLIRLDGAAAPAATDGLRITGAGSMVRGLIVTRFSGAGIRVVNANNVGLDENIIGVIDPQLPIAPASSGKKGNLAAAPFVYGNDTGIIIQGGSGVQVGGNTVGGFQVVAENKGGGIRLDGGQQLTIQNCTVESNGHDDHPSPGGGIDAGNTSNLTIANSTFADNAPFNVGIRKRASGFSRGSKIDGNKFRTKRGGRGPAIHLTQAQFDRMSGNTIDGIRGAGVEIIINDSGGSSDIIGNTIRNCEGPAVLIQDGIFNTVGGFSPGQENTIYKNGAGILVLGGSGNCVVNNTVGLDNLPRQIPPSTAAPTLQSPTVAVSGSDTTLTASGTTGPQRPVFVESFGLAFVDNNIPVMQPIGSVSINSDANGNFTTPFTFPTPTGPQLFSTMAASAFGDSSPMVFTSATAGPGNVLVTLIGPDRIALNSEAVFTASFTFQSPATAPYAVLHLHTIVPAGFQIVNVTSAGSGIYVPSLLQRTDEVLSDMAIPPGVTETITFTVRATQAGAFNFWAAPVIEHGDNSKTDDDSASISGQVFQPATGADVQLGNIRLQPNSIFTGQRGIITIPLINGGTVAATEVGIDINPGAGGMIFEPTFPDPNIFLDPVADRWVLKQPLTPGQTLETSFGFAYTSGGLKTITVDLTQKENDPNSGNNGGSVPIDVRSDQPAPLDFGDAPDSFLTILASNGARHGLIENGPRLGGAVDADPNGLPGPNAEGDDFDIDGDDEDGVVFRGPIIAGLTTAIDVTVNKNCFLEAWIDYDGNDVFDFDEYIAGDIQGHPPFVLGFAQPYPLVAGLNRLFLQVRNNDFKSAPSYMRARITANGGLMPFGFAPDGEVEDYAIDLTDLLPDFGDAPDSNEQPRYPTLLVHNGAYHLTTQAKFHLGVRLDLESDAIPSIVALGDDQDNGLEFPQSDDPDDEDGVTLPTTLRRGQLMTATVFLTDETPSTARLDGWIDYNQNSNWTDAGERVLNNIALIPGSNSLQFTVPAGATIGKTFARFRLSRRGNLQPFGPADSGEVEDYLVDISEQAGTPTLTYSVNGTGDLVLNFTGFLDSAPEVIGPWTRRATQSPFTVDPRVGMMFFQASSE